MRLLIFIGKLSHALQFIAPFGPKSWFAPALSGNGLLRSTLTFGKPQTYGLMEEPGEPVEMKKIHICNVYIYIYVTYIYNIYKDLQGWMILQET